MSSVKDQFVVDDRGNRTAVLIEMERYVALLSALEELESIRAFDEAKASQEESIPFIQAVQEIEDRRA